jgi:hypothetical protein
MNQLVKYTLIVIAANLLFAALLLIPFFLSRGEEQAAYFFLWFFVHGIAMVVQFVTALVFIINKTRTKLGQAVLIALGILLLVGLGVCGGLVFFSY